MAVESFGTRPSSEVFLSSVGTGLSITLIYFGIAGNLFALSSSQGLEGVASAASAVVFSGTLVALYALLVAQADRISTMNLKRFIYAGSLLCAAPVLCAAALAGNVVLGGAPSVAVSCVLACVYAVGVAAFRCAGVRDLRFAESSNVLFATVAVMTALGVGVVLGSLLDEMGRRALVIGVLVLDVVFYGFSGGIAPEGDQVDSATSKGNLKLDPKTAVSYGLTGVIIAFTLASGVDACGFSKTLLMLGVAIVLAVVVAAAFVLAGKKSLLLLSPTYRMTLVPLVALVLVLPAVSGKAWAAAFVCSLAVLFLRDFSRVLNRLVVVAEAQFQPMHVYAWTSFPLVFGLFAGLVLFEVLQAAGASLYAGSALIVILLCVAAVVAPYGCDPQSMPLREVEPHEENPGREGYWRRACEEIASEAGLTPRETDVAVPLSRGRSADVIAQSLGISVYTVKTHISNVYRKTATASQQDFMSLVEARFDAIKRDALSPKERL